MNDNAAMLNMNTSPTKMARIPIIVLNAVNPDTINAIPKNTKLNPINMDKVTVLSIGQIIKLIPRVLIIFLIFYLVPYFFLHLLKK